MHVAKKPAWSVSNTNKVEPCSIFSRQ